MAAKEKSIGGKWNESSAGDMVRRGGNIDAVVRRGGVRPGQVAGDGVSRRGFLTIGALGAAGLTLPDLLRAEATAGIGSSEKSVINIPAFGGMVK